MDEKLLKVTIREIQGSKLHSPLAGQVVRTEGVVTGLLRRGFYLQTPYVEWDGRQSDAVFVYSEDWLPEIGYFLEISGQVVDYIKHETAKPITQIRLDQVRRRTLEVNSEAAEVLAPITIDADFLPQDNAALAQRLNSLEGMVVELPAGMRFIAPSNPFGDYVLAFADNDQNSIELRSKDGGVLIEASNPNRWYPGFRVYDYRHAKKLNVGSKLKSPVRGSLHYRVDAWQIAVNFPFDAENNGIDVQRSTLMPQQGCVTIMTLNCFNLDPQVERPDRVMNPKQDIDDDWGEGRFHSLARAIIHEASSPDIVALQEIQDNDGAEQSEITNADATYALLVKAIKQIGGAEYQWVDIAPKSGADGGQPGGNIRNGFLYNPLRVELVATA